MSLLLYKPGQLSGPDFEDIYSLGLEIIYSQFSGRDNYIHKCVLPRAVECTQLLCNNWPDQLNSSLNFINRAQSWDFISKFYSFVS